ncbi:putative intracellular septation protein A [Gammaproteobacteria bacterium]
MKLLYDFFPVLLFFVSYKFYGIYTATKVAMVAALLQTTGYWLRHRHFETVHLVTLGMILVLGGATLFFHNPVFIKWKPTVVNWLFAGAFLGSHWVGEKTIVERMLNTQVDLPGFVWIRLNLAWVVFFILSGIINLYVAYNFAEDTWVNFKLFGMLGLTIAFIFLQTFYISRYIKEDPQNQGEQPVSESKP